MKTVFIFTKHLTPRKLHSSHRKSLSWDFVPFRNLLELKQDWNFTYTGWSAKNDWHGKMGWAQNNTFTKKTHVDDWHIVVLCNKYLTKHRGMVNLVVVRLCGGCECRGNGVVPHTLLVVRLLVETEKRWRPCTETVGFLEHSQWELLQTKSTNVLQVVIWLITPIFLFKDF